MSRFHPLFRASLPRVILETLAIGALLWCVFTLIPNHNLQTFLPWDQQLLIMGLLGAPWCALRLDRPPIQWWRQRLREICLVEILCLTQGTLLMTTHLASIPLVDAIVTTPRASLRSVLLLLALNMLLFLGNHSIFMVIRVTRRTLIAWNHLRRTQLQWSLTHAHALVVALGTLLVACMVTLAFVFSIHHASSYAPHLIIPVFAFLSIIGIFVVLSVIPPSTLFSYLVVRQTVNRIRILMAATSVLRSGNYAVRVPVQGEDEVAQLQADFNAMAAALQRAMADLQLERDTVAGLLESRRELVASASHELRTPVATLRSSLETTLTHWTEHPEHSLKQDLLMMENEVLHLQTLVENLFTLARADVGRLSLRCEPTDIGALIEQIVKKYAPLAWQTSKIEVISDLQPHVPKALVDSTRVEQVVQNLLHNSVRHTAPGGIVALVVGEQANRVIIQVKSTGEGMTNGQPFHAWEHVYQSNGGKGVQEREEMGGLGLALVKEWTESMGGQITAENVPGEGYSFRLSFPAVVNATVSS